MSFITISTGNGQTSQYDEDHIRVLLKQGALTPETLCLIEGERGWIPLYEIFECAPANVEVQPEPISGENIIHEQSEPTPPTTEKCEAPLEGIEKTNSFSADDPATEDDLEDFKTEKPLSPISSLQRIKDKISKIDWLDNVLATVIVIVAIAVLVTLIWISIAYKVNFFLLVFVLLIGVSVLALAISILHYVAGIATLGGFLATGFYLFEGEFLLSLYYFGGTLVAGIISTALNALLGEN